MRRRQVNAFLAATAIAGAGRATAQSSGAYHLGTLGVGQPIRPNDGFGAFLMTALVQHGYAMGQNLVWETRAAAGRKDQLPRLMQELKAANVAAVVAMGYPAAVAAKASRLPTIIAFAGDPVGTGLVDSLARPGDNVTGIADDATTLSTKRLALLKEMSPQLRRVAMLWNQDDLAMSLRYQASAKAAQEIGVAVVPLGVREPDDFNEAFAAMNRDPPDAILMVSDSLTMLNRKRVIDFALERRLPTIFEFDSVVRDGGLMSYGADPREVFGRVGALVDRIFKGAKPSDLPVEHPTRYLFLVNMKTARAMNLAVPDMLLAMADDLIE